MFRLNSHDMRELEKDLKTFKRKSIPFATRKTLNDAAFTAQKIYKADAAKNLTLRNRFTQQSIQVEQARGLNIRTQESVVGSTAPYMEDQEFGGVVRKSGKYGQVIPTSFSANQEGQQPRTRLPTAANRLKNIRLKRNLKHGGFKSKRQMIFVTALVAANKGQKHVFIPADNGGIYRVWGRKKKAGKYTRVKMKMVYSMRRGPTVIKKQPLLGPAFKEAQRMIPAFYADSLRFQARRHGLFK